MRTIFDDIIYEMTIREGEVCLTRDLKNILIRRRRMISIFFFVVFWSLEVVRVMEGKS